MLLHCFPDTPDDREPERGTPAQQDDAVQCLDTRHHAPGAANGDVPVAERRKRHEGQIDGFFGRGEAARRKATRSGWR